MNFSSKSHEVNFQFSISPSVHVYKYKCVVILPILSDLDVSKKGFVSANRSIVIGIEGNSD